MIFGNWFSRHKKADINGFDTSSVTKKYCEQFGVLPIDSSSMSSAINCWNRCYMNSTSQLMKTICCEASKLCLTDLDISVVYNSGSKDRVDTLNAMISGLKKNLTRNLEYGLALGGLLLVTSDTGVLIVPPTNYIPISYNSEGDLISVIITTSVVNNDKKYVKLEYHHYIEQTYVIETKCLVFTGSNTLGTPCSLSSVREWADINPVIQIDDLERPLFSLFKVPGMNNIDVGSASGISLCSPAISYINAYDVALELFNSNVSVSKKLLFIKDSALFNLASTAGGANGGNKGLGAVRINPLPNLIQSFNGDKDSVFEYNPILNVEEFKSALSLYLNTISSSCGFTSGYFSFESNSVAVTATQVESEDARTVGTITSIRKSLEYAIRGLVFALNEYISLTTSLPEANFEFNFYARDLSDTPIADREHTLELVKLGYYPLELYLKEYEGFTEEEANKIAISLKASDTKVQKEVL